MDTAKITDRLRKEMHQKIDETGISILSIAVHANVPRSSLRGFLGGGDRIQLNHAASVCEFLGIRLDLVLYGRLRRSRKIAKGEAVS